MLNFITQHRRGTTDEWISSTVVPEAGELVIEERKNSPVGIKIGDGIHKFNELSYIDNETVNKLNELLQRYNQHVAYIESGSPIPDSTIVTEVLDARTVDGNTYDCLAEALQNVSDKHIGSLVYDVDGTVGLHQPYYLYLTDKNGNILDDTGVQIVSGSPGGGGGSGSSSILKIERVTPDPYILTVNDQPVIEFIFTGVDSSGETITQVNAVWRIDGVEVMRTFVKDGLNKADYLNNYLNVGTHKVLLVISDDSGSSVTKTWNVNIVDIRVESTFDSTQRFDSQNAIPFTYTPFGAINKEVHFILDGVKLLPETYTTVSGSPQPKTIPPQSHGSHYLEVYITADIEKVPGEPPEHIKSNSIFKDLISYDFNSENVDPVIGTDIHKFTCKEYDTTSIEYTIYSNIESPTVVISITDKDGNEEIVATPQIKTPTNTYNFRADNEGTYIINISCGNTTKHVTATVEKLEIPEKPVTEGLAFDFNPVGKNNEFEDRLWTDGTVSMTVSDNFDWINGGYQKDEDNNVCFVVKSGSWAEFDYTELFSDTTKSNGREFKVIFKTTNIKKRDTSVITCRSFDSETGETYGIGLDMRVESANIYSSIDHLYSPYAEEDIIEFEYNISNDIPLILTYEDGVANRPLLYTESSTLTQGTNRQPIRVGSKDCDVYIYRMKAYNRSLNDTDILSNFVRDARTAEEIANRSKRNKIYDDNNVLNPVVLAEKCPDLRVVMIEAPRFTYDKDDKVENTTIRMIYTNGRKNEDNWVCTGAKHSGQGTSSNEYGYAGRNLDLIMNTDTSLFTLNDGTETKKITLTDTSVPTDYLNIKVNIASSENTNNAQMANRYNKYNPFKRVAKLKDSRVKDCMEFYNCVVFIKETGDVSQHQEFKDNEWHFYAIGNVGDSKKTDNTRVNDKEDPKECVVEILDWNLPLSSFPTGVEGICPVDKWVSGNSAYDSLHAPYKYKEGKFKSFGDDSYEFRYEKKGITDEQRVANIEAWQDFYKFVVTSDNETFKNHLDDYFVTDSALFYYLFTERYTMVDNRAKNSFWHYGKVYYTPEEAVNISGLEEKYIDVNKASINEGYRWDLTFGYDFDTSLGIDNVGKLTISYGKEDIDYYNDDPKDGYIYRAAESTFFTRIRDLFVTELQGMYLNRESAGAWDSTELINQWDSSQNLFPEELWRLDIQRKYIRTYLGISLDNSLEGNATSRFLTEMLNGRKRYQRRMFERNQELYMATKYFGKLATANNIFIRLNNPQEYSAEFSPQFKFELTPYSDMYIGVSFANGTSPVHFRAKQGQSYPVESPLSQGDITLIYGARFIQAISSLARCYVGDNDFSKATKLQSIVLGNTDVNYSNTFLSALSLESNPILEHLDVSNLKKLENLKLNMCFNLKTLFAEGSSCNSVEFATGGMLQKFYLPEVTTLILRNLSDVTDYRVQNTKIQELIIEDTPNFNSYEFVSSTNTLTRVRLTDIEWTMPVADTLMKLVSLNGFDIVGKPQNESVVTGTAHINNASGAEYKLLSNSYKELKLTFDALTSNVYFRDENDSVVDQRTVYNPELAGTPVNPYGVTLKNIPEIILTKEDPTGQYDYKQEGWTTIKGSVEEQPSVFDNILGDRDVYPRFVTSVRNYTLRFFTGNKLIYEEVLPYGSAIRYDKQKALNNSVIDSIIDAEGNPLKQDTGSPFMYKFVAFLPDVQLITRDTSLYADFVLSLDNVIPATLSEFEYTRNDTDKTLSLNKYIAVPNDEVNDSDSITTILEKYEVYEDTSLGEYTVTSVGGFNPNLDDVTVNVEIVQLPEKLREIQDEAFFNCGELLKAEIPLNVEYLGKKSFANCSALDEVQFDAKHITNNISNITESPFNGSGILGGFEVSIGNEVTTIPAYMFAKSDDKTLIRQLNWGNSPKCTTIQTAAFRKSTPANMSLPDSVTKIEDYAFFGNRDYTQIDYEEGSISTFKLSRNLTYLGTYVFDEWTNLRSIKLPRTLTLITGAFAKYCPNLESLEIEQGSSRYRISGNAIVDTVSRKVIQGCNNSTLFGGENGILEIGVRAFEGSNITTTDENLLPDSLTKLGNYAFSHCNNITIIKIPNKVTTIPTQCFEECSNLETVYLHDSINTLGTYLFWNCKKLNNVHIPTAVTAIPGGCFIGCSSLENVELPPNLKTIDMKAFENTSVKHVVLPNTVYHLSTDAYSNCKQLESFTFGTEIQRIGGSSTNQSTTGTTPFAGCVRLSKINCPFSKDNSLAATAPWGAGDKQITPVVYVTYNYGSENEETVEYTIQ